MSDLSLSTFENLIGSNNVDSAADPPVLLPPNEKLLSEIVRKAVSDNLKIRVKGRDAFPAPGFQHDGIVVSTTALSSIIEVNPEDFIVITQAGVSAGDVVREAEQKGFLMPLDIIYGSEATAGGAFMAGTFGLSAYRYKDFSDSVIGIKCVTADGEIVIGGGRTAKNVTGYDITRFFAGTMGLFAIAYELTIKLSSVPESRLVITAGFPPGSELKKAVTNIVACAVKATLLEVVFPDGPDGGTTIGAGIDGLETIVDSSIDTVRNILNAAGAKEIHVEKLDAYIIRRREAAKNIFGPGFYTISVPPFSSGVFFEKIHELSRTMPVLTHPAEGKFHVICCDEKLAGKLGKTSLAVGGKHPVGWNRLRKEGISHLFTAAELEIIRKVKRELDPSNILNPHLLSG